MKMSKTLTYVLDSPFATVFIEKIDDDRRKFGFQP